ncbi:MAG: hypothetical protein AB1758_18325 [Candidatus Eremiobacterota bacterium]
MIIQQAFTNGSVYSQFSNAACGSKGGDGYAGCTHRCGGCKRAEVAAAARSEETIRPEVQQAVDLVRGGEITQMVVAKGIAFPDYHQPQAPGPFHSVDHHVTFEKDGSSATVNFTTGLGHLAPVTPGETAAPGPISVGQGDQAVALNNKELDSLLGALYSRFSEKLTDSDADTLQHLIDTAASVRFQGNPELIASKHAEYSQNVIQPQTCPGLRW